LLVSCAQKVEWEARWHVIDFFHGAKVCLKCVFSFGMQSIWVGSKRACLFN